LRFFFFLLDIFLCILLLFLVSININFLRKSFRLSFRYLTVLFKAFYSIFRLFLGFILVLLAFLLLLVRFLIFFSNHFVIFILVFTSLSFALLSFHRVILLRTCSFWLLSLFLFRLFFSCTLNNWCISLYHEIHVLEISSIASLQVLL
jgi:hypothetical protein